MLKSIPNHRHFQYYFINNLFITNHNQRIFHFLYSITYLFQAITISQKNHNLWLLTITLIYVHGTVSVYHDSSSTSSESFSWSIWSSLDFTSNSTTPDWWSSSHSAITIRHSSSINTGIVRRLIFVFAGGIMMVYHIV